MWLAPPSLPPGIAWHHDVPAEFDGLLIAHEWLDNVPCDVVELDDDGDVRLVLVDPETGDERLGDPIDSAWLDAWWPLTEPGERAEIGERRDEAWAEAVEAVTGLAVAIDYGHLTDDRPPYGSLASYRDGQEVDIRPDGSRDVTAHVAVDAVCDRVGGCLERQRDALARLGVQGARPPLDLAHSDPPRYLEPWPAHRRRPSSAHAADGATSGGSCATPATRNPGGRLTRHDRARDGRRRSAAASRPPTWCSTSAPSTRPPTASSGCG